MNKILLKSLIWGLGISGGLVPFTFNFTSPEHLAWVFYLDIGTFMGLVVVLFSWFLSKVVDVFSD